VRPVAILVAIGVNSEGFREILGVAEGAKEDEESWTAFLRHLKKRGFKGVRLVTSDKCLGLVNALGVAFPDVMWQRCVVHFYRNVFTAVPNGKIRKVARMLKAIHPKAGRCAAPRRTGRRRWRRPRRSWRSSRRCGWPRRRRS